MRITSAAMRHVRDAIVTISNTALSARRLVPRVTSIRRTANKKTDELDWVGETMTRVRKHDLPDGKPDTDGASGSTADRRNHRPSEVECEVRLYG